MLRFMRFSVSIFLGAGLCLGEELLFAGGFGLLELLQALAAAEEGEELDLGSEADAVLAGDALFPVGAVAGGFAEISYGEGAVLEELHGIFMQLGLAVLNDLEGVGDLGFAKAPFTEELAVGGFHGAHPVSNAFAGEGGGEAGGYFTHLQGAIHGLGGVGGLGRGVFFQGGRGLFF